jgi:hypothetical protein
VIYSKGTGFHPGWLKDGIGVKDWVDLISAFKPTRRERKVIWIKLV